tara:strand:- start:289 stop:867 length:579 start_codon:yes stop_codon:yes gene_type:complete
MMTYLKHIFFILFIGATLLTASCENKPSEKEELELLMKEFDKGIINADEYKAKKAKITASHNGGDENIKEIIINSISKEELLKVENFEAYGCAWFNDKNDLKKGDFMIYQDKDYEGIIKINNKIEKLKIEQCIYGEDDLIQVMSNKNWKITIGIIEEANHENQYRRGKVSLQSKNNDNIKKDFFLYHLCGSD